MVQTKACKVQHCKYIICGFILLNILYNFSHKMLLIIHIYIYNRIQTIYNVLLLQYMGVPCAINNANHENYYTRIIFIVSQDLH
ncbi:hypothetical protein EB796_015970 [Bugula neritina]|uniref:Uncharacterized protein n=1 Tax=Bugula neritina TaxID=10212 RepID=A0A7J7JHA1_BUGNE|nr:hypothetical protein EB796_015970 [Bugula neritina]